MLLLVAGLVYSGWQFYLGWHFMFHLNIILGENSHKLMRRCIVTVDGMAADLHFISTGTYIKVSAAVATHAQSCRC